MEAKPRILLLEDDPDMRSLLERILSYQDYDVTSVETGFEAIEAAKQATFDLVVADVRVEGPDGIEVLSQAKRERPDVGTLAVSGYSSLEDDARAEKVGIGGFLRKPFETQRFLELVKQQLHKRHKKKREQTLEQDVASVLLTSINTLFQACDTPLEGVSARINRARELAMRLGSASRLESHVLHQVAAAAALAVMPTKLVSELNRTLIEVAAYVDSLSEALLYYERPNSHDPRPPLEARIVALVKAVIEETDLESEDLDRELVALYRSVQSSPQPSLSSPSQADKSQSESFMAIAQTLERAGDLNGATNAYKEILQSEKGGENAIEALLGLARLAAQSGDSKKTRYWVDEATKIAGSVGRFRSCLTDYYGGLLLRKVADPESKRLLRRAVPSLLKFGFADAVALSAVALVADGEKVEPERWNAIARRLLSPSLSRDITKHASWFLPALLETLTRYPIPGFLSRFINHLPGLFSDVLENEVLSAHDRQVLVRLLGESEGQVPEMVWKILRKDTDQTVRKAAKKLEVRVEALTSPSLVRLFSMGPLEVQVDGETIPDRIWRTQRTRLLLAYLGYEWGRQAHEDVVIDAVWGDRDSTNKKGLYWSTSALRRIFKGVGFKVDIIERIGETLRGNPEVSVWHDVNVLENHLQTADQAFEEKDFERSKAEYQAALDLYRGPYMEGCFLEWALQRRQSLERQVCDSAMRLAELHFEAGSYREAVEAARAVLNFEATRQEAHLMVMKGLMETGRPEAAIDQYHECEKLLHQYYGTEPETVMIEFFHRARMLM